MKKLPVIVAAIMVSAVTLPAMRAATSGDLVKFPDNFEIGVRYATVERGNIREEIFTGRKALEAAKRGEPLPSGSVISLVDYRDGRLFRYVVMEKGSGWGAQYAEQAKRRMGVPGF